MKDIPGFEREYAATSCGKIWSYKSHKFLIPKTVRGYHHVDLFVNGVCHQMQVHRLVAMAYIPNPNGFPCVNHKDENKINNCVGNLEWCTYQYNNCYGTRLEKARSALTQETKSRIISACIEARRRPVKCIEIGRVFKSQSDAAKELGMKKSHIGSACRGKRNKAGGYHWEYAEAVSYGT